MGTCMYFTRILQMMLRHGNALFEEKVQCMARIKLSAGDEFIEQTNEHTHPPSQTNCDVAKIKSALKRRAETSNDTSRQILSTELRGVSETASVNLPSMDTMRRNIRAARQDRNEPPNPINRAAIPVIPQLYQSTENGDQFLLYDSGNGDPERIIIFSSQQAIQFMSDSEHWFADGTFKVCPDIFFQVYTVHAQQEGRIFPCIFGLLPNKTEATYTRFFREVFNNINGIGPADILLDFERSALNALGNVQPLLDKKGCFFHLSSNVWKHIRNLGMQARYNQEPEFALHLRMLCALAFLPPNDVINGFVALCQQIRNTFNADADDLLEYFEDTYIGRFRQNAPRRNPLFAIDLWNMYHRTDQELPRTNNSIEGWHRSFQAHLSACHPNVWKFISILKKEEALVRTSILQHQGGHPVPPQRRRYADCNARIIRIVDNYPNRQLMDYLRSIAHNIAF